VPWPAHGTAALTEAVRRAVLRLFVRGGLFERDDAQAMLAWPHSGFHVRVIDANVGGNAARYVNHSCEPNVELGRDQQESCDLTGRQVDRIRVERVRNVSGVCAAVPRAGPAVRGHYDLATDGSHFLFVRNPAAQRAGVGKAVVIHNWAAQLEALRRGGAAR
jgi:hypothetical protein